MNWFFIALVAPALWSATNHIDKHLISKYFSGRGIGALLIFSSLIGFMVFPIIYIFHGDIFSIKLTHALLITLNGGSNILFLLPYIYALQKDEASNVVPLFQTAPIFSYILGFVFLGEVLSFYQLLAGALILIGAIILSLDFSSGKIRFKSIIIGLMLLSSFVWAFNSLIFKFVAINSDFWTTYFWSYMGSSISGLLLLVFIKKYRQQFLSVFKTSKKRIFSINILNEVLGVGASLCFNYATLLAPLALVTLVNGFQPFFVLLYGVILTIFFPSLGEENLSRKNLSQKIFAISIMFAGSYLLNISS